LNEKVEIFGTARTARGGVVNIVLLTGNAYGVEERRTVLSERAKNSVQC
jgi:hypothetical protein